MGLKPRVRHPDVADYVRSALRAVADPAKAGPMAAYMKTDTPFYGVQKNDRVPIARGLKQFALDDRDAYEAAVLALWQLPHREEKYLAIALARMHPRFITLDALPLYERMIREGAWWDLVDDIAAHLVGAAVFRDRARGLAIMDRWIDDPDLWIRRTAILCQLRHNPEADAARLFRYCAARAHEREFFIRKAIGWALRQYAYHDPAAVRAFLAEHKPNLSGLSYREAAKHL